MLCSVIKDGGDDPDVTNGAEILVEARPSPQPGIHLRAGAGVGIVTKPGLELPVGAPAINPVPRRMITETARAVLTAHGAAIGLILTFSIPGGEELARRTLNPRLGIVGGLSILGTTGIVEPYSASSYKASITKGMDVARAVGVNEVVLATGRRTERFAQALLPLPEEAFIEVADFMRFGLEEAVQHAFQRVFVAALIGKLSKMAKGELETHSRDTPTDIPFLVSLARRSGAPDSLLRQMLEANTARQVLALALSQGLWSFPTLVAQAAAEHAARAVGWRVALTVLFFAFDGALLAKVSAGPGPSERREGVDV